MFCFGIELTFNLSITPLGTFVLSSLLCVWMRLTSCEDVLITVIVERKTWIVPKLKRLDKYLQYYCVWVQTFFAQFSHYFCGNALDFLCGQTNGLFGKR